MRSADSYRGQRRNATRVKGKIDGVRARTVKLNVWRSSNAANANAKAKIAERAVQANAAREFTSKMLMASKGVPPERIINSAFLTFYRGEKRTRVVNRIIRGLERAVRTAA